MTAQHPKGCSPDVMPRGRAHDREAFPAEVPPERRGRDGRRHGSKLGSVALITVLAVSGLTGCSASKPTPPSSVASSPATPTNSAVVLGASEWPAVPDRALPSEVASKMGAEVQGWVDKELLPGVTVAVVSPEGVWTVAAGVDGDGTPLQANSGMALASITKTFTAAEVMLLAERGQLDLDAPASTYLDQPLLANGTTVRQLLAHRSSITEGDDAAYAKMMTELSTRWSTKQALAPVPTPTGTPGRKFSYVNINYILLGLVIAQATGLDLAAAFTRDLWRPLGLTRVAYQDHQALAPPLARPGADPELPNGTPHQPYLPSRSIASVFGPAGGAAADAETTARWGYDLYGAQLLQPDSVAQMTDFDDGDGYGLGTMDFSSGRFAHATLKAVGHLGVLPGYRTVLAVFPAGPVSIAILTPSTVDPAPYVKWLVAAGQLTGDQS
jgi:D-alanyl-D-alanine carboxypeptidase